jgi:hypothetical protein
MLTMLTYALSERKRMRERLCHGHDLVQKVFVWVGGWVGGCVRERARARESVCVSEREREKERERLSE